MAIMCPPSVGAELARPVPGTVGAGLARPSSTTFEIGVEERVRSESWSDITDHDAAAYDARTQLRFRTRAWLKASFGARVELGAMLVNESKKTVRPDTPFKADETVFENLYVDLRVSDHVSVRAGRQGLMRGEGFVLADGSALDGSRTLYVNAVDMAWTPQGCKGGACPARVELIAISDPHRDTYLPRFNENAYGPRNLIEWDERAVGLYCRGEFGRVTAPAAPKPAPTGSVTTAPVTTVEGYLFRKTETGDTRAATSAAFQPDRTIGIAGGRVVRSFGAGWTVTAEAAYEWGTQDANPARSAPAADIAAWGGYAYAKKVFGGASKPALQFGWIGMSGDDPWTARIEAWDPLFARWPKYSELYIYAQVPEKGVAYWSNLALWQAEFTITPVQPLALRATWYRLGAFHPWPGSAATFGTGTDRGDLWQARADLALAPHWKLHALYERLAPGDFYTHRDPGWFLRVEASWTAKM